MSNSLFKIAKELNVGTGSIVEFLNRNGFDIENKPNAKITDEMYGRLLKEFQKSIDDKEASRHVNIGMRGKATPEAEAPVVREKQEPPQPTPEKTEDVERPRVKLGKPTVLGKIDLGGRSSDRSKEKETGEKPREASLPAVEPTPAPEPIPEKVSPTALEEPEAEKISTPQPTPQAPVAEQPTEQPTIIYPLKWNH